MASCDATGPPVSVWLPPTSVVTSVPDDRFWMAPNAIRATAATTEMGSRMRTTQRTRSTQKLPTRSVFERVKPRMTAITTAMPTAADTKFCTARPAICVRWPIVASPE